MIQRTLGDVLAPLAKVAAASGLRVDDSRLTELINEATERLLSKVEHPVGTIHRLKFCQYDRQVALPSYYESIIRAAVDRENVPIMGKWYEFMDFGPGHVDSSASSVNVLVDRGEGPVIRQSISTPVPVRCYGYKDERVNGVRPKIRILGYDEAGVWVRTQESGVWVEGEAIEINGDGDENWSVTTTKFSRITQVIKPVTNGPVELYFYNPDLLEDNLFFAARYEFWETNPVFRLYYAPGIPADSTAQFHCLCKVRFRPLIANTDKLIIGSLPALKKALRALAAEEADDETKAEINWQLAADILNEESKRYNAAQRPNIDVARVAGAFGDIPNVQ